MPDGRGSVGGKQCACLSFRVQWGARFDLQIEGPCTHREDEPTVLCISLLGLVQRTCEHAVERFYRRTGPCLRVTQSQQLLDCGREVHDDFRREQNDKAFRRRALLCENLKASYFDRTDSHADE